MFNTTSDYSNVCLKAELLSRIHYINNLVIGNIICCLTSVQYTVATQTQIYTNNAADMK